MAKINKTAKFSFNLDVHSNNTVINITSVYAEQNILYMYIILLLHCRKKCLESKRFCEDCLGPNQHSHVNSETNMFRL